MSVTSKWVCNEKKEVAHKSSYGEVAWHISFGVVYAGSAADGKPAAEENRIFGDATPSGSMQMFICNPNAAAQYTAGQTYIFESHHAGPPKNYHEGFEHDPATGKYLHPVTGIPYSYEDGPQKAYQARTQRERDEARTDKPLGS